MRRGAEHCDGGYDCEQCEDDEAEAIDHHGGELPVVGHLRGLVLLPQLVGDHPQLLEDERELPVGAQAGVEDSAPVFVPPQERVTRRLQRPVAEVVVNVEHVGQQTLGRPLLQFQLPQLQRLPTVRHVVGAVLQAGA